jgi:transcriptional regulator of acetoin/glycerol metabolism
LSSGHPLDARRQRGSATRCAYRGGVEQPKFDDELREVLGWAEWPYSLRQLDGVVQQLLMEGAMQRSREMRLAHCVGELARVRAGEGVSRMPKREVVRERMRGLRSATAVACSLGISRWRVYRHQMGSGKAGEEAGAERGD